MRVIEIVYSLLMWTIALVNVAFGLFGESGWRKVLSYGVAAFTFALWLWAMWMMSN